MNLKKILVTCLILMILSITAVSAADLNDINATDSAELTQEIESLKTVEQDTNLQPISENKPVHLSNIKATSTSPGTFDDLQLEINNAEDGSVLVLTKDYNGHYESRIHLDKDITIDGQGHTLNCLGKSGCFAFFSTTGNIVLKNIRIINGHNDYNNQGGAIHIEGSAQYTLENCEFENNLAKDYGGAIYNDGQSLTIKNCTFKGNSVNESGGAIYSTKDVTIDKSTFTNNKAKKYGGAVESQEDFTATKSLFESNEAAYGGTIHIEYMKDKDAYIKGCIFKFNTAVSTGGAVEMNRGSLYIDNSTFENNKARLRGGTIVASTVYINTLQSKIEAFNTYFIGNQVSGSQIAPDEGGAIYAYGGVGIVNTCFKDNMAKTNGGAIYSSSSDNINIDHCLFEGNNVTGSTYQTHGGAIYAENDAYIHNSTFKNNYAYDYGGAIYAKNVKINPDSEFKTADTFFIDNKAKDNDGGAIYVEHDVFARNVAFINNAAYLDGGAIYAENNVEVIYSIFESNQANGATIARCYGGAIRAKENTKINNCTFKNNNADNRGGAVYASTVTAEGGQSTFEGNSAKDYGGAIYTDTFTDPVSHVSFINNMAGDGGAVYLNNENWITFTDCVFMNNRATNKGGAIYLDSKNSHLTIRNNVLIGNSAGEGHSVFNYGYYDAISDNYWSIIPSENNDQLVEWKAWPSDNIHHIDTNPATFTIEIIGSCCANLTSGVKLSFVHQDGTPATLPMIADLFAMYSVEGIEIGDKKVSSDGITIWFTPTEAGTYELPAYILGMTGTITINVIEGGAIIPVPIPEQDIIRPDIPKPYIPPTKTTC